MNARFKLAKHHEYSGDRSAGRKSNSQNKYQSPT